MRDWPDEMAKQDLVNSAASFEQNNGRNFWYHGFGVFEFETGFIESSSRNSSKVAIIAPRDEHCSRTYQIPIRMFSNQKSSRNICPDASATLESFPTHAHHAER